MNCLHGLLVASKQGLHKPCKQKVLSLFTEGGYSFEASDYENKEEESRSTQRGGAQSQRHQPVARYQGKEANCCKTFTGAGYGDSEDSPRGRENFDSDNGRSDRHVSGGQALRGCCLLP